MIECASNLIGKYPSAKVTMVGHSLGGALATLFAIDLQILGYKMTNLFTYGYFIFMKYDVYNCMNLGAQEWGIMNSMNISKIT